MGFIRTKLIAVYLGTFGTGIISQLTQSTELMARFTVSGMNDGLVKEIAESDKKDERFKEKITVLVKTYITLIAAVLLVVITLSLFFSKQLTIYFFGNVRYVNYFLIGLASFPILVINGISFALLKSFKQIKFIARSELIVLLINIMIFIPLIFIWKLTGVVVYITFAYITILIVNQYYARSII